MGEGLPACTQLLLLFYRYLYDIFYRDPKSYWVTTGLYPQEFVVELDKSYDIAVVTRSIFRT